MPTELQIIDAQIDGIRHTLYRRVGFLPFDVHGFHNAWRRCPDLRAREKVLYGLRDDAQAKQDKAEARAAKQAERAAMRAAIARSAATKCPTCGFHTLTA